MFFTKKKNSPKIFNSLGELFWKVESFYFERKSFIFRINLFIFFPKRLSKCQNFDKELLMSEEYYIIRCLNKSKLIYSKGFVSLENNLNIQSKKNVGQETRPMKIILIGIDGVSTAQFQRTLPKLGKYLQQNQWVKFTAYNKVGENTFPNLMALLTGIFQKKI